MTADLQDEAEREKGTRPRAEGGRHVGGTKARMSTRKVVAKATLSVNLCMLLMPSRRELFERRLVRSLLCGV